jgi:hypothetical protein
MWNLITQPTISKISKQNVTKTHKHVLLPWRILTVDPDRFFVTLLNAHRPNDDGLQTVWHIGKLCNGLDWTVFKSLDPTDSATDEMYADTHVDDASTNTHGNRHA